jgi:hypothetical protein
MVHLFSSISGNIAVTAYTVDIFHSAGTHLDDLVCTVIFGITDFVSDHSKLFRASNFDQGNINEIVFTGIYMFSPFFTDF